jgi:hypothetical protein
LQDYFDRWGIEVNHRDEKEILGIGQAQVWNQRLVSKVPALLVAMYSWLLLGGLASYDPQRTDDDLPLPPNIVQLQRPDSMSHMRHGIGTCELSGAGERFGIVRSPGVRAWGGGGRV